MSQNASGILAVVLALGAPAGPALAMPMAGSFNGHVDSQVPQPLGAPDHVRVQQTASGSNTGPGTPLDGARVQIQETVTLKAGQGSTMGTITFQTPSGTTRSPYQGTVVTDAQGRITAQGSFRTEATTGEFAGLAGQGRFTVRYETPTEFVGEWSGDFTIGPAQATQR